MMHRYRSHTCGELRGTDVDIDVRLSGWLHNRRDLGGVMYEAFRIAGYRKDQVDEQFGGMVRAFHYGAPPHAGVAPGVDRIVMLLADEPNIRETIAFPLNQNAEDILMGAPSPVSEERLKELHLNIRKSLATSKGDTTR
ncbi:MAG: amino acid--tRNA ligase-related protein [Pseudonocardia sp.]